MSENIQPPSPESYDQSPEGQNSPQENNSSNIPLYAEGQILPWGEHGARLITGVSLGPEGQPHYTTSLHSTQELAEQAKETLEQKRLLDESAVQEALVAAAQAAVRAALQPNKTPAEELAAHLKNQNDIARAASQARRQKAKDLQDAQNAKTVADHEKIRLDAAQARRDQTLADQANDTRIRLDALIKLNTPPPRIVLSKKELKKDRQRIAKDAIRNEVDAVRMSKGYTDAQGNIYSDTLPTSDFGRLMESYANQSPTHTTHETVEEKEHFVLLKTALIHANGIGKNRLSKKIIKEIFQNRADELDHPYPAEREYNSIVGPTGRELRFKQRLIVDSAAKIKKDDEVKIFQNVTDEQIAAVQKSIKIVRRSYKPDKLSKITGGRLTLFKRREIPQIGKLTWKDIQNKIRGGH